MEWHPKLSGRAIDFLPNNQVLSWLKKNYGNWGTQTPICNYGGEYVHWAGPVAPGSDYIKKCSNRAVVKYIHKKHPEWLPVYRCSTHQIRKEWNADLIHIKLGKYNG